MTRIVERTCTEIRRPAERRDSEPRSEPLSAFRSEPAYVLLGDPGSGKTTAFRREREELGDAAVMLDARDFLTLDLAQHPEWEQKTLFIDGLDEVRARSSDMHTPLDSIRARLDALRPPSVRISCREADWLGESDRARLETVAPGVFVTTLRLDPLSPSAIEQILGSFPGIDDAYAFVERARERGVKALLSNPQTLNMLADVVGTEADWPESRLETFEMACRQMATEHNDEHALASPRPSLDLLLDAAGYLCAVQLVTGAAGHSRRNGKAGPDFLALSDCDFPHFSALDHALGTKLFGAVGGGRLAPVHRHVAEFLGARYLARRIRDGLPARRVLTLISAADGPVVTEMRGLSGWLAAHCSEARALIITRDPLGAALCYEECAPALSTLIALMGRSFAPAETSGFVTLEMSASGRIGRLIRQLCSLPGEDALQALDSLVSDPALTRWRGRLERARDDQRVLHRDAAYRHPNLDQLHRALADEQPANPADLAALLVDRLRSIATTIQAGNSDDWRPYWNEDAHGRPDRDRPKHENSCRDALLSQLRARLPDGVDAQPEGQYAGDRRSDIRVSCDGFNVPVEIKKDAHRDVWSAIRDQLIKHYTRDAETSGYGIYLVLWFGRGDLLAPPHGVRPTTPAELERRLEETLTADETSKVSVIVIDPHADLVAGILEDVPASLIDRVKLVDLAAGDGFPGINLLDTRIFSDRDRTADSVVRVARGLWEQWGPRMQSILEQTVKTLHEANTAAEPEDQYTILDGLRLLSDEGFRANVLACVEDPYLLDWWARDFGGWRREYRAEALAPVQTRLSYYASSKRARAILGQSRSTIDLRRVILDGGVLLVSTAQGTAGRDVAALVGASLLNLVDSVIREQERVPLEERRGALVVVDEMQSMPGVDYESMLSELGKYGASFVLATQSLAKLADLSPTMQDTVLANTGCLAVFQVAGSDARKLVWELGRERVTEEDITSQPVHHCYVRATVGTERIPAFSMRVAKPEAGDPGVAASIRAASAAYTTSATEVAAREAQAQGRVKAYREGLRELTGADAGDAAPGATIRPPAKGEGRRGRQQPDATAAGEEGEP